MGLHMYRFLFEISAKFMPDFIARILDKTGWVASDIDIVVTHQASAGALSHLSKRCGFVS